MTASSALRREDPAEVPADISAASPWPVETIEGAVESGVLLLCDHASNAVPPDLGDLGLPPTEFQRHIAYDIGAAGVTRSLARRLNAPAVLTRFSRLIIDPNRGRDDPTLVMRLSDGAVVPGNARITDEEVQERIRRFYDPYDAAVSAAIGPWRPGIRRSSSRSIASRPSGAAGRGPGMWGSCGMRMRAMPCR